MTDIAVFPTLHDVCKTYGLIVQATTSSAVTVGQSVSIDATGTSNTVRPALGEAGERPVGVALYSAANGAEVAIASVGSIALVVNADDTTTGDAGGWLITNDGPAGGTVNELITTAATTTPVLGFLLEDLAASGTAYAVITPQLG